MLADGKCGCCFRGKVLGKMAPFVSLFHPRCRVYQTLSSERDEGGPVVVVVDSRTHAKVASLRVDTETGCPPKLACAARKSNVRCTQAKEAHLIALWKTLHVAQAASRAVAGRAARHG